MNAGNYMQWYYLIYLLPGGTALLLLLLSALSGGGRHHQMGGGHGHHPVVGHHHGDHPGGGRHHADGGCAAHGHTAAGRPTAARQALAFFGVGRVPAPFLWGSALLGWGLFGFWATRLLESTLRVPAAFVPPALGLAALGALGTARLISAAALRLLPPEETFVTGTVELCGLTGTVAFPVDEARGRVHVYDAYGTLHDVSARAAPGQTPIARGHHVLVMDYDAARDFVIVEEMIQ
ncbi:MAG: DUF1449 family protein [Armatimonadetes bacterium]|nr:DUF1449 family protein [Armatimonadota bacterium]